MQRPARRLSTLVYHAEKKCNHLVRWRQLPGEAAGMYRLNIQTVFEVFDIE